MSSTEPGESVARPAVPAALESCRRALADYEAGLVDEAELERTLVRAGLVHHLDEAWAAGRVGGLRQVVDALAGELRVADENES